MIQIGFNLISASALWGISQALLLMVIVLSSARHNRANLFLALAVFSFGISISYALFTDNELISLLPHLMWVGFPFQLLQGPAVYLYLKTLLAGNLGVLKRRDLFQLLPFVLVCFWLAPFYILPGSEKAVLFYNPADSGLYGPGVMGIVQVLIMIHIFSYIALILVRLRGYSLELKQFCSDTRRRTVNWLHHFCIGYSVLWILLFLLHVSGLTVWGYPLFQYLPVFVSLGIFYIGVKGANQQQLLLPSDFPRGERKSLELPKGEPEIILGRLVKLAAEERPFLKPDLTLAELAGRVGCPYHHLSQVLNTNLKVNFNEYINRQRADWAAVLLENPALKKTILEIAMESGFGTKASFNAFFKKQFHMTPGEYRRSHS